MQKKEMAVAKNLLTKSPAYWQNVKDWTYVKKTLQI